MTIINWALVLLAIGAIWFVIASYSKFKAGLLALLDDFRGMF